MAGIESRLKVAVWQPHAFRQFHQDEPDVSIPALVLRSEADVITSAVAPSSLRVPARLPESGAAMKDTLEKMVDVERFSMPQLANALAPLFAKDEEVAEALAELQGALGGKHYDQFLRTIVRNVFLIELVKVPAIETTKFRVRWYEQLNNDPRFCSYEDCLKIARLIIREAADTWIKNKELLAVLHLFFDHSQLPYEAPIDYISRDMESIHRVGNVALTKDPIILPTLKLRAYLAGVKNNEHIEVLKKTLENKVRVKTYLTDRALTGAHKTNREKRWEAHPASVQFSTRTECLRIEHLLLVQLCGFEDFPQAMIDEFRKQEIIKEEVKVYRCPVTQIPMSYPKFKDAILNPQHGTSSFQVGHLNPLKLEMDASELPYEFGHHSSNIGWISSDGNRIQGSLGIKDTRALLRTIAQNYEDSGWD
jgi:hypothetical protein